MKKSKGTSITVKGTEITILPQKEEDYLCLTDIARHKNPDQTDDLIRNWLRNRNTLEFLGIWEQFSNPVFNSLEFEGFRMKGERVHVGVPQEDRLNAIIIRQMQTLTASPQLRRLSPPKGKEE